MFGLAPAVALWLTGTLLSTPAAAADPVREILGQQQRQQEAARCTGLGRALATGADPALVVKTAVELGYGPCQVVRCALERKTDLLPVLRGAAAAGVGPDVIARCSIEAGADPETVAALLADLLFEPSYCYFAAEPPAAMEALPPLPEVIDRELPPPQASPFSF